jgi:HTH-type transcriptional regulator, transcriptional repressor of NAD biosynthesis genes
MSAHFRRGLVVGKFCPLHLGHEFLIREARARCDSLLVLSWTKPGFDGYDRERRAAWLHARFPDIESLVIDDPWLAERCAREGIAQRELPDDAAPDDAHRRFAAWLLRDLLRSPVDAVFTSEDYGDGFAAVLSAEFAVPVAHICVDLKRGEVPVSGTRIRQDPSACREFLPPEVWSDFVPRVALLGGESTGKSTLARALAEALGTVWIPEYGRELWERRSGALVFDDMEHIGRRQVAHEQHGAQSASACVICDTTPLTTLLYSEAMFGRASGALRTLSQRRYALTLLCLPDFPFVQDGTRQEETFRAFQHKWYLSTLDARKIPFVTMAGSLNDRVRAAREAINGLRNLTLDATQRLQF